MVNKKINDLSLAGSANDALQFETDTGGSTANKVNGLQIKEYAALGISGGRTLEGGTAANDDLILDSTSDANKGDVSIGTNSLLRTLTSNYETFVTIDDAIPNKKYVDDLFATSAVSSVFSRTGAVVATTSDYDASQVDNDSGVSGATVKDALDRLDSNFNDLNKKSLLFDGVNDYVAIPTATDMEFERTDTFSFSFWFKPTTSATGRVYSKRSGAGDAQGIELIFINNKLRFLFNGDNSPINQLYVETTSTFTLGVWHHVVITYDGSSSASGAKIYINNVSDTLTTIQDNLSVTTVEAGNIHLAANRNLTSFLSANIDNFAAFDAELSAANVTEIYNKRIISDYQNLTFSSDLIHWWRMGDFATSFTIIDEVGSINGTMTNMVGSAIVDDTP